MTSPTVTADAIVEAVTPPEPAEDAETIAPPLDPAPTAVLVDTDVEQPEVPAPPAEHEEHEESKPKKKSGLGMWGA